MSIIANRDRGRNREGGYNLMKISKLEFVILLLTAAFLAFAGGWFLRGSTAAEPIRVEVQRTLSPEETPLALPAPTGGGGPDGKININTADSETLQTLPGIGEKRAEDIIAYREAHGPFRIAEDLTRVKGIGESILAGLLEQITVE